MIKYTHTKILPFVRVKGCKCNSYLITNAIHRVTAQMQQQQIMQNTEMPTNMSSYKASEGSDLKILRAGLFLVITKNKTE